MGISTKTSTIPLIRLAHPMAFGLFLQEVGTPIERLFRRLGLPVYCDDPSAFVPLRQAWSLFDAAARLEDSAAGWHVGRFYWGNNLNAGLLKKLENKPTLYQALQKLTHLITTEASHLQLGIQERRDDVLFYTHYSEMKDMPGYTASQAYQLEGYLELIRHYLGPSWVPEEIGIEYPTVPSVAEEHFPGSRILTSQRVGYISIRRSCLHTAARSGMPDDVGEDSLVRTRDLDYVDTLRALLEAYLADGYPSARQAASLMDTSVRTLARKLDASGLTYRAVIDEMRFNAAKELLSDTSARITDVATSVGFDDPAHFARMFRRIGGLSPRDFRRAAEG